MVPVQSEQCIPAIRARIRIRSGRLAGSRVQRSDAISGWLVIGASSIRRAVSLAAVPQYSVKTRAVRIDAMKSTIKPGLSFAKSLLVNEDRCIGFMGKEGMVYATPKMVSDVEYTCRDFLLAHLD